LASPPSMFRSRHDRARPIQEMSVAGVFEEIWRCARLEDDDIVGLRWAWPSMDGAMTKAPLGGEATRPNPTDRAKRGTKRSLLTESAGIPIGLAIVPANRSDHKLLRETLDRRPIFPPDSASQHRCLDKGCDYPEVPEVLEACEFVAHIRSRGEEVRETERHRKRRPRRWVVEGLHCG
jgi:putative transposase